jgi:hypothetical protein
VNICHDSSAHYAWFGRDGQAKENRRGTASLGTMARRRLPTSPVNNRTRMNHLGRYQTYFRLGEGRNVG